MNLPPSLRQHRAVVNAWLQTYLTAHADTAEYGRLVSQLERLVMRSGKRIRPGLCLLAYEGYGGSDSEAVVQLAGALELLHTYFLIHDDIIDRDMLRHGGPNISGAYHERFADKLPPSEAEHYAAAMALLAGDTCRQLAYRALNQLSVTDYMKSALIAAFLQAEEATLRGETNDVSFGLPGGRPSVPEVFEMYGQKTAAYSFGLPLQTGSILAGADPTEQPLLTSLGTNLGLAYQLQDDLLDLFGDERMTGKPVGSDLGEGKPTVLVLLALQQASSDDAARLRQILGAGAVDEATCHDAREIIDRSGAKRTVEQYIDRYSRQARGVLATTAMTPAIRDELTACINAFADRKT